MKSKKIKLHNKVKAPWIKQFYYTDDNCYIIPNVHTVCLGGTRNYNNFSLELNDDDSKGIWDRCKKLCPSLEVNNSIFKKNFKLKFFSQICS